MTTMREAMKSAGLKYAGENTEYSRGTLKRETIAGYPGVWLIHEFGGDVFVPDYSETRQTNRSCFEQCPSR